MEFRQIEAFVNAVKYKSFSRAADVTFISQPTISTHIGNLENELGAPLLNRGGREITLTPKGQAFYPYAVSLLHERQRAITSVKSEGEELRGILDLQASSIPGQYFLPMVLQSFSKDWPSVRYYVEQSDSRNVIENIKNQRGEIGFTGCRENSNLSFEPVFSDEFALITPRTGRFLTYDEKEDLSLELFKDEPFILREDGSGTRREMEKAAHGFVLKNVDVVARMNSMEAICQSVSCGLGVSVVSRMAACGPGKSEKFCCFKIKELSEQRIFYMVYNKNMILSPIAERFRNHVRSLVKPKESLDY